MKEAIKKRGGRLEQAMRARDLFVPHILDKGFREAATVRMPAHWRMEAWNLHFIYVEGALLLPTDQSLSCLLDIWSASHKKQLSISWQPDRPRQPLHIASFDALGAWIPLLDLIPAADQGNGA